MSKEWLSDLISEYETLDVEQLATSAKISGEITPSGWELLTTLRNEQIEKALGPDVQHLAQEELKSLQESVEYFRAEDPPGKYNQGNLSLMQLELAEFSEERFVVERLEDDVYNRIQHLMVYKRNEIIENLDLFNASVDPHSLDGDDSPFIANLDGLIKAGVYQILNRFFKECNRVILDVWRRTVAHRAPVELVDTESLVAAFDSTNVHISHPDGELVIPSNAQHRTAWPWKDPVWVVTAHNPGGIACSDEWNKSAHRSLRAALRSAEIECLPATGRAPDGSWEEPGYALIGVSKKEAIDVARQYGQLAIFRVHDWRRTVNKTRIKKYDGNPTCEPGDVDEDNDPSNPLCQCGHRALDHREEPVPAKDRPVYADWCPTCDGEGCEECELENPLQDSCLFCSCDWYVEDEYWEEDLSPCYLCGELPIHHPFGDFRLPGFVKCEYYEGLLCGICGVEASRHKASAREDGPDHDFWITEENFHIDTASAEELMQAGVTRKEAMAVIAYRPHGQISLDMTRIEGLNRKTLIKLLEHCTENFGRFA